MKLPLKSTLERILNYYAIPPGRLRRYLDHSRVGVASFPANKHNKKAMDELLTFIESEAPESLDGTKILDIGCGDGYILSQIRSNYNNTSLSGISVCRDDISLASKVYGAKVKFGDMHSIPEKNKSIDTVIARHCLEHSPMPLFVLFEIHRIMKNGSGVLVVVLPAYSPYWVKYKGHFHCMPKDNWIKLFGDAGFEVLSEEVGYWFAVATNKPEEEWRFLLQAKTDKKYNQPYTPFYVELFNRTRSYLKRY